MNRLDGPLTGFTADLKAMGVWDDTIIVIMTEFGRRNFVNGSDGTDHGHGYCTILCGGGVNGGMYGPDLTDVDLNQNWLTSAVDFRSIYKEVLNDHMGSQLLNEVFPEAIPNDQTLGVA